MGGGNNNGNDRSDEAFRGRTMPNGTLIGCLEVVQRKDDAQWYDEKWREVE